jgi:2-polyprenyl-3-methyl-5-hydroxy-6-metoxy-1,4-benzoquinol methylase
MRPYTRSLDPADYAFLPHAGRLRAFESEMRARGVGHRDWHEHRLWEYASMMQQLEELGVPKHARIIDVGSGGSFFPPYLATVGGYPNVTLTDSMKYGDVLPDVQSQRQAYNVDLPLYDLLCEDMSMLGTSYDVTMCISTIEHVDADQHDLALQELWRITKPGGYIFITSDYFKDDHEHFHSSPSKHLQFTPYTADFVRSLPSKIAADFVGETDLDYRGHFVHNYSFCNICLRKRHG